MKTYQAITIVGMMGAGKTSVAKKLSKKLNIHHIDTDLEVKSISGMSVKTLIDTNKEKELKDLEFEIIQSNSTKPCIISTGDYTVNNQKSWNYIMHNTVSIWMHVNVNQLIKRLKPNENRPFFPEDTKLEDLKKIYIERKKRYAQAKIHVTSLNSEKTKELISIINYFTASNIIL